MYKSKSIDCDNENLLDACPISNESKSFPMPVPVPAAGIKPAGVAKNSFNENHYFKDERMAIFKIYQEMDISIEGNMPSITKEQLDQYNAQFPNKKRSIDGLKNQLKKIRELFIKCARIKLKDQELLVQDPDKHMQAIKERVHQAFVNNTASLLAKEFKNLAEQDSQIVTEMQKFLNKETQKEQVPKKTLQPGKQQKSSSSSLQKISTLKKRKRIDDVDQAEENKRLKREINELRTKTKEQQDQLKQIELEIKKNDYKKLVEENERLKDLLKADVRVFKESFQANALQKYVIRTNPEEAKQDKNFIKYTNTLACFIACHSRPIHKNVGYDNHDLLYFFEGKENKPPNVWAKTVYSVQLKASEDNTNKVTNLCKEVVSEITKVLDYGNRKTMGFNPFFVDTANPDMRFSWKTLERHSIQREVFLVVTAVTSSPTCLSHMKIVPLKFTNLKCTPSDSIPHWQKIDILCNLEKIQENFSAAELITFRAYLVSFPAFVDYLQWKDSEQKNFMKALEQHTESGLDKKITFSF